MEIIPSALLNPLTNGLATFVVGVLFVLTLTNFFLYFQNKKKVYLLYSLYTLVICVDQTKINDTGFLNEIFGFLDEKRFDFLHITFEWTYNTVYTLFAIVFLNLKSVQRKWFNILRGYVIFSFSLLVVLLLVSFSQGSLEPVYYGFVYFSVPIGVLTVVPVIYLAIKYRNHANTLLVTGSVFFIIGSLLAFYYSSIVGVDSWVFFYFGVLIENVFFTLALGRKQKIIVDERKEIQSSYIEQLKVNDRLKEEANVELELRIKEITAEIEQRDRKEKETELEKVRFSYEKKLSDLKVQALQAQMNPHFIFNSLNSIKLHIINNEKEEAVYYLNKFSKLVRTILSTMRKKSTSLEEEIDTMKLYVGIENIRFEDELNFEVNIDPSVSVGTIKIPPLILQPFIENAIWHGLSACKCEKKLAVSVTEFEKTHVEICIEDNGIGRRKSQEINAKKSYKSESIGISLTMDRLAFFSEKYTEDYFLDFIDLYDGDTPKGTKVVVRLPLV